MTASWPSVNFRSVTNERFWKERDKAALPTPDQTAAKPLPPVTLESLPSQRDLLRELVDAFHARKLKVYVIFLGRFPECYVGPKDADAWSTLFTEVTARGVDGISVTADEANLGMAHPEGETRPADDPVRVAFRKRFGDEARLPKDIWQRSVDYKRWVTFCYERNAGLLSRRADAIRKIAPGCATMSVISSASVSCNNRMTYGVAYDVIGRLAGLDYLGTDYLDAETRLLTAANAPRGSCMELFVPRSVRQGVTAVLQGSRLMSYYRYNYIESQHSRDDRCREFAFFDVLARWGVTRANTVPSVACVVSRASEDWWDNDHGTNWLGWNPEAKRGFWSDRAINQYLRQSGIPFDMFYLDRPETLGGLGRYGVILLPFPYAIGDEALEAITRAHVAGARVLILQRQGEVGQYGEPRTQPALAALIATGQGDGSVSFVDRDLLAWETDRGFAAELTAQLDRMLGDRRRLDLSPVGDGVESFLLENGRGGYFLALINWRDHARRVAAGLRVGEGDYAVLACSSAAPAEARQATVDGQTAWTAAKLRRFMVELAPGEVLLLGIQPANHPWTELAPAAK